MLKFGSFKHEFLDLKADVIFDLLMSLLLLAFVNQVCVPQSWFRLSSLMNFLNHHFHQFLFCILPHTFY